MYLCYFYIFSLCILLNGQSEANQNVIYQYRYRPSNFKIYYNLHSIIKEFTSREYCHLSAVQKTLYAYQHICPKPVLYKQSGKRRPFIAIEGTDRIIVSAVSKSLTLIMGATYLPNPPKCFKQLLGRFTHNSPIRRTFYALGNYVVSNTAKQTYNRFPVIVPGYWLEQSAFAISNNYKNRPLPHPMEKIYNWPVDLLPPDVIFHLRTPKTAETLRWNPSAKYDWRTRTIDIYDLINHPSIVRLDARMGVPRLLEEIVYYLNTSLRHDLYVNVKQVKNVFPLIYPTTSIPTPEYGNVTDPT